MRTDKICISVEGVWVGSAVAGSSADGKSLSGKWQTGVELARTKKTGLWEALRACILFQPDPSAHSPCSVGAS